MVTKLVTISVKYPTFRITPAKIACIQFPVHNYLNWCSIKLRVKFIFITTQS